MSGQQKITERYAASLQWRGTPYIVWDADLDGYGVRVWGDGSKKGYVVQVKRDGRSFRKALGKVGEISQEKARAQAIAFRGAVKSGRDPRADEKAERGAWTLQAAMDYFLGDYAAVRRLSDGHKANAACLFAHHVPERWKTMKLSDISQGLIATRHRDITGGRSSKIAPGGATRANYWLALMSRLFSLGETQGHCPRNPCKGIKKNELAGRERFLSAREIATLWNYLEKHKNVEAAACVQFILLTGCRPGEAFTMKWSDLDRVTGTWKKPATRTKQRRQHSDRLTNRAIAVLGRLKTHERSPYVFPSPGDATAPRSDKLKKFWQIARAACAIPDVRLYDCRHSFASWLAMGGATELEIAAQLGHSNVQTTRRYAHIAAEHLRARASIMDNVITKALEVHLEDQQEDQQPIVAERVSAEIVVTQGRTFSEDDLK